MQRFVHSRLFTDKNNCNKIMRLKDIIVRNTNQICYPCFSFIYFNRQCQQTTCKATIGLLFKNWWTLNLLYNTYILILSKHGIISTSVASNINPCVNGHTSPDTFFFFEDERAIFFPLCTIFNLIFFIQQQIDVRDHKK